MTEAVRPLDVRDLPLLQTALLDVLTPGRATHTLVARLPGAREMSVVGQIAHDLGDSVARVGFVGPADFVDSPVFSELLDALTHEAGWRGARNLIAEVDEDHPAFESLRRAGFAIYARQQIWGWQGRPPPEQEHDQLWRSEVPADAEAIQWLVASVVPGLVLQVEASPGRGRRGLLHWSEGELRAYLDLERGPRGVWAQPYIHPAVEGIDALLAGFLRRSSEPDRPTYLCLRSYQGWMAGALERIGFERIADQAVMVRRLAATVRRAVAAALPALNHGRVEPTTPFARVLAEPPSRPRT
jgi:hypothetical protein